MPTAKKTDEVVPEGWKIIYRPFVTTRDGRKLHASWFGKRAWRLIVPAD